MVLIDQCAQGHLIGGGDIVERLIGADAMRARQAAPDRRAGPARAATRKPRAACPAPSAQSGACCDGWVRAASAVGALPAARVRAARRGAISARDGGGVRASRRRRTRSAPARRAQPQRQQRKQRCGAHHACECPPESAARRKSHRRQRRFLFATPALQRLQLHRPQILALTVAIADQTLACRIAQRARPARRPA